jgi:hypothetical protein
MAGSSQRRVSIGERLTARLANGIGGFAVTQAIARYLAFSRCDCRCATRPVE